MEALNAFAISGLVNGLIVLGWGIFVISHNWRDRINRLYFLIILATSLWAFSYWRWLSSDNIESGLIWVRLLSVGSTFIPIFFFHWLASLLKIEKSQKIIIRIIYILGVTLLLFSFSRFYISGVEQKLFFPYWPNPGLLYNVYLLFIYIFLVIYSIKLLIKHYKKVVGEEKKRIEYVLLGISVAFGGGFFNFPLWYDIPILPYGNFVVALFPFFFGYATIKYHLFNVKVIATELFAIAIWAFLFVKILISGNINDLLLNGILFIIVVFFGLLLIKSVIKEVEQKEKIAQMAEEVKKSYEVEKKANEELKLLDNVKNQFLTQTQHDLRTPLSTIRGYCDLMIGGTLGKQNKKTIDVVKRIEAVATAKIQDVDNFLDAAQFRLGKGVINAQPGVNVMLLLDEIQNTLKLKYEQKGLYLNIEKPSQEIVISADKEKLKAAIFNIVDNAIKYTEKGGITIKLLITNNKLLITISDTGIGIPAEKVKTIFEDKFERTEQAKKVAEGKGVGLYLSGQIIKLHNGKAWVESDGEGKGSAFYIELPIG